MRGKKLAKSKPLYATVKQALLGRIRRGEWQPGERVPAHKRIAETLDISEGTVSRAITDLTKEGFLVSRPRSGVRVADRSETCTNQVALLSNLWRFNSTPAAADPWYQQLLAVLQSGLAQRSYELTVISVSSGFNEPLLPVEQLYGRNLAALVCMNILDLEYLLQLKSVSVPVIVIDRDTFDIGLDCVVLDNLSASYQMTSELIAAGHRDIAFIGKVLPGDNWLMKNYDPATSDRYRGYRLAFEAHKLPVRDELVAFAPDDCHINECDCIARLDKRKVSYTAAVTEFGGNDLSDVTTAGFAWCAEDDARTQFDIYAYFNMDDVGRSAVELVERRKDHVGKVAKRVILAPAIRTIRDIKPNA